MTKEEKILVKIYEASLNEIHEVDFLSISRPLGLNDKGALNSKQLLVKSNFLRKNSSNTVEITEQGIKLASSLCS